MNSLTKQLEDLGIDKKEVPSIVTTLEKAKNNYKNAGFNVSQKTVNEFFISQYKKAKHNKRKTAMNAVFKAKFPPIKKEAKIGRNEDCPCGSEKKYKKCCL
ncbi:MAG: SEC-C metal-binding domain-containing protein [Urechidicola sp.]|nr:SEC-C metal-binding domain-containing protein [Urechidicola sp.]